MKFQQGKQKTGGRTPGVSNKFTGTFREALRFVYDGLGGHAAFLQWARKNKSEYYHIASRLIPAEMRECEKDPIRVFIYGREVSSVSVPPTNPRPALLDHMADDGKDRDAS